MLGPREAEAGDSNSWVVDFWVQVGRRAQRLGVLSSGGEEGSEGPYSPI